MPILTVEYEKEHAFYNVHLACEMMKPTTSFKIIIFIHRGAMCLAFYENRFESREGIPIS